MICAEAKPHLTEWADGELAGPLAKEVEDHLEECSACAAESARLRRNAGFMMELLSDLSERVNPDLSAIPETPIPPPPKDRSETSPKPRSSRLSTILVGSAILLVAAVVYVVLPGRRSTQGDSAARSAHDRPQPSRREVEEPRRQPHRRPETPSRPTTPSTAARSSHPVPVKAGIVESLGSFLSSPSRARIEVVWSALGRHPSAADTISQRLRRARSDHMRAALALCLAGANRDPAVRSTLIRLLADDGSATVRAVAAAALARSTDGKGARVATPLGIAVRVGPIRSADVRSRLLRSAESERNPVVLRTIIEALGPSQSLDPALTRRFLELARTATGDIRRAAVKAVESGRLSDPGPVLDVVRDTTADAGLRASLVPAAARAAGDRAGDVLSNLVQESEAPRVRAAALAALVTAAPKSALPAADRALREDQEMSVKLAAISALARLGTKDAMRDLKWAADQATDERVRRAARQLLGGGRQEHPPRRGR